MWCLILVLLPLVANWIFVNVGIKCSTLHISTLLGRNWSKDYREYRRSLWQRSSSHMVKHNIETTHTDVNTANFKIINMNFSNSKKPQKTAEYLWTKDPRPTLNALEKSIHLTLFNLTINNTYCHQWIL